MLLSHNISRYLKNGFTYEQAIDLLAEAGFDAIDWSFFDKACFNDDNNSVEAFAAYRAYAESKGLVFNQSHAPFPSSFGTAEETELRVQQIVRAMELSSVLGVKIMVVHPMQHMTYENDGVAEKLFAVNMDFYRRLIPYCERYNVKVGVENMWQSHNYGGGSYINHSTCSTPAEMIRYLDTLDSPWMVGCLDVGHALLVREQPDLFIRALGNKRLQCLHVHDVSSGSDLHTLPYYGGAGRWEKITAALKEIGYEGDMTYEASNFLSGLPQALFAPATKYMAEVGRYLISRCL